MLKRQKSHPIARTPLSRSVLLCVSPRRVIFEALGARCNTLRRPVLTLKSVVYSLSCKHQCEHAGWRTAVVHTYTGDELGHIQQNSRAWLPWAGRPAGASARALPRARRGLALQQTVAQRRSAPQRRPRGRARPCCKPAGLKFPERPRASCCLLRHRTRRSRKAAASRPSSKKGRRR